MPVITIELAQIERDKKVTLVKELVQKASEITGIPEESFVTLIKENGLENVGSGTKLLSEIFAEKANK